MSTRYTVSYTDADGAPCFVVTDFITHVEVLAGEDYCLIHLTNGAVITTYTKPAQLRKDIEFSKQMREE